MNGRVELTRERFGDAAQGSEYSCDRLVDETEAAVSVGARQLCVREGTNARSFDRGRENLRHAAQIIVGEEKFRQLVEGDGKNVLRLSGTEQLELDWSASQCKTQTPDGKETTRLYVSGDGVLTPTTTQSEKGKRRPKHWVPNQTRPNNGWRKFCTRCGTRDTSRSSANCWIGATRCAAASARPPTS